LQEFLSEPLAAHDARRLIERNLASREDRFLALLERGVYGNSRSPYLRLLRRAGAELGDVAALVRAVGVEAALSRLHDAGVWLSLGEAKGKEPIRRGDFEHRVDRSDLHNRLASRHFQGRTGGSRSGGTMFWVDLDDVVEGSAYAVLARSGFGLEHAAGTIWLPAPPGVAGMRRALWWAKAGMDIRRWFAQSVPRWRPGELRRAGFVRWTVAASRRAGRPLPAPEHTPPGEARRVAGWLSQMAGDGLPGVLFCTPSTGLRVCETAAAAGLEIGGTFFSFGGEPFTEAKARAIVAAGCRAESSYYVSELGGPIALGCASPSAVDVAHLAEDRVAAIVKERRLANSPPVRSLYLTTISLRVPQVAVNLETGDYAIEDRATCGCPYAQAGLSRTLHTIRSYEKLTTEGMHFVGPELVRLLEEVLPARFGGGPADYQLIEEEDGRGRTRVSLAVSPGLGPLDERQVEEVALTFLRSRGDAERMMADIWAGAGTLHVVRREPETSAAAKVLPLHVARPGA
jgi:hypothetical protein